jgi:hypothetical protein
MPKLVTLTNDFHNSSVQLRLHVLQHIHGQCTVYPSKSQIARAKRVLCGTPGCTCSNDVGTRGKQTIDGLPLVVDVSSLIKKS